MNKKTIKNEDINPPIPGEFANWAGVTNSDLQTIIDFGFIQPAPENQPKIGVINRRIILPPTVAKQLGEILMNSFKNVSSEKTTKKKS